MKDTLILLSKNEYYWKEKLNLKPNTIREIRPNRIITGKEKFVIIINEDNKKELFKRNIKDISFFDKYVIISWREE